MKKLWKWSTAKASRTWVAHGAVSLGVSGLAGVAGRELFDQGPLGFASASTLTLLFYAWRELGDERKHKAAGRWNEPGTRERVTPAADQAGDLVGPLFVCLCGWAGVLL